MREVTRGRLGVSSRDKEAGERINKDREARGETGGRILFACRKEWKEGRRRGRGGKERGGDVRNERVVKEEMKN